MAEKADSTLDDLCSGGPVTITAKESRKVFTAKACKKRECVWCLL